MRTNRSPGQTPLDPDELLGLLDLTITTKGELDRAEQFNIAAAHAWYAGGVVPPVAELLSEDFLHTLHRQMFANVWEWAGEQRRTDKNIGGPYYLISRELRQLCDNGRYWAEHDVYGADELALRFKHQLVSIHVYPNGNGRHSRLLADLIAEAYGKEPFSWGASLGGEAVRHFRDRADRIRVSPSA